MPRETPEKTPAKTPAEKPEQAGPFGGLAEILARIEQEGPDAVYVTAWRERPNEVDPERCHDYPARGFTLDKVRDDFGPGQYVLALHRTAGHAYVMRRRVLVSAPPRGISTLPLPHATPGSAAATPAAAPVGMGGGGGGEMFAVLREIMAESRAQNQAVIAALTQRPAAADITLKDLLPLFNEKQRAPLTEFAKVLDMGRSMARASEGGGGKESSLMETIAAAVLPLLTQPAQPQQPRFVPNAAAAPSPAAPPRAAGPVAPQPQPTGAAAPEGKPDSPIMAALRAVGPVLLSGARNPNSDPEVYAEIIDDALGPALDAMPELEAIITGSPPAELANLALSAEPRLSAFAPWLNTVAAALIERFNPAAAPAAATTPTPGATA